MQIEIGLNVSNYPEIFEPIEAEWTLFSAHTITASKASLRRWKKAIADFKKAQREMTEAVALQADAAADFSNWDKEGG